MKKIVFIALSLAILSLAVLPLSAEKRGKGDGHGRCGYEMGTHKPFMHLNKMQEKLGLTNDQVDKMYKIYKDYMDRFYQNRNNPDKIKELRDQRRGEMANVLTPEQKAKWEEMRKNRQDKKNRQKCDKK